MELNILTENATEHERERESISPLETGTEKALQRNQGW